MTATLAQIGWGSYDKYEGPFFHGNLPYMLPPQPSFEDKVLRVFTATEGGTFDAVNMYDRCIVSVGLVQWCEGNFSVSRLLGRCLEVDQMMFDNFRVKFPVGIEFKKNKSDVYRFFSKGVEVSTPEQQRTLFLGGPLVGYKGKWDLETKAYAKQVAVWFANLWDYPLFRTVQAEFTKARFPQFVLKETKDLLFAKASPDKQFSWDGALRAAFYSFAGNLPTVANKSMQKAASDPRWAGADPQERFRLALQALTFGPGISIYPGRYGKIAPVVNQLFGVSAPTTAEELKSWGPPPADNEHRYSELELEQFARMLRLSTDVMQGKTGMDALAGVVDEKES